ncbi:TonB C-terminal domain-containing protein [Achromobacter sp. NPDC058515]|uniref:TonB C-terminal domain-containing protein n=1 Tax=Achromobacter sp. NPDC058515 TaxID=3346533 RepID=UPI00365141F6
MCLETPALAGGAASATSPDRLRGERYDFALPAQALGDSLEAIGRLAGVAVLVDERYARQPAPALSGRHAVMEALRRLLDGSGLRIRQTDGEAIVVYAPPADGPARASANAAAPLAARDIPGARAGGADFSGYIGRVQKALLRTLCGNAAARPGGYRLALQLRLDGGGQVARMRLLDTTGSDRVDAAVTRAIQGMDVGAPPPAGMPQPVSVLLLPGGTHCAAPRRPAE